MKKEDVEFFLSSLIAYAVKHFHREESHMIQIGFDDIVRHKAAHEVFLVKVSEFHDRFRKTDGLTIIGEMSKFLGSWWTDHILREDRRYMTPAPPKNPRV